MLPLYYLQKRSGGRLHQVATFSNMCDEMSKRPDASWELDKTLQAANDYADVFAHIGVTSMLQTKIIVKLMMYGKMAKQEQIVSDIFRQRPHRNIVQSICNFSCKDRPIRWERKIEKPTPFCNESNGIDFVVILQEYIRNGDLHAWRHKWTYETWTSVFQQLTYACMECYEMYGFLYGDWHFGNILMDVCPSKSVTYAAFGRKWRVTCHGYCPLLTDFARSDIRPSGTLEPWQLASQLGLVWDLLHHVCPKHEKKSFIQKASVQVSAAEDIGSILSITDIAMSHLKKDVKIDS